MTNELKQEYTLKITQANKSQMVVLVYDISLSYIQEAKELLEQEKYPEYKLAINHVQNCISDLMSSLNFDYELSYRLMQLYTYANRELIRASIHKKAEHLLHAESVLQSLQAAFSQISKEDDSKPMMENAQTIVAGLTYGRNTLNESLNGQSASRGFCV